MGKSEIQKAVEAWPDTASNAAAVCPNCHRRYHLSEDCDAATERLYEEVERLVKVDERA